MQYLLTYLTALWDLVLEAAPWLVLGILIGGLFKSLMPQAFLQRHLTKPGVGSIFKAALMGVPLPLCSCGVIPAAMGLREAGASKPATTSFLVSTPETGVDSISITYAMMGPFMAIIRPLAALFSAMVTGLLVFVFADKDPDSAKQNTTSCCGDNAEPVKSVDTKVGSLREAVNGVKYAFTDLYQSILKWLIIGLLFAASVQAFVPENWLLQWGDSWLAMFVMMFVGIPMYVCATGSTPIAAGFLMAGISPGAVLVFLLAGPATNMATLGVVQQQMGQRTMWLYLLGIISSALLVGVVVNLIADQVTFLTSHDMDHAMLPNVIHWGSALLLLVLAFLPWMTKKENGEDDQPEKDSCCG